MSGRGGKRIGAGRKRRLEAPAIPEGWYVYVMSEVGDGRYLKVGIASNPVDRLSVAQTSNPRNLFFAALFNVGGSDLYAFVEKSVHTQLRPFHVRGEWFEVPLITVLAAIDDACVAFGIDATNLIDSQKVAKSSNPISCPEDHNQENGAAAEKRELQTQ